MLIVYILATHLRPFLSIFCILILIVFSGAKLTEERGVARQSWDFRNPQLTGGRPVGYPACTWLLADDEFLP
jgi:hypothetical protein